MEANPIAFSFGRLLCKGVEAGCRDLESDNLEATKDNVEPLAAVKWSVVIAWQNPPRLSKGQANQDSVKASRQSCDCLSAWPLRNMQGQSEAGLGQTA